MTDPLEAALPVAAVVIFPRTAPTPKLLPLSFVPGIPSVKQIYISLISLISRCLATTHRSFSCPQMHLRCDLCHEGGISDSLAYGHLRLAFLKFELKSFLQSFTLGVFTGFRTRLVGSSSSNTSPFSASDPGLSKSWFVPIVKI